MRERGITVPWERLGDLVRDPFPGRICRHAERHPKSTPVAQNDETIENLKRNRRQDKQIDRRDAIDVILEKRPPSRDGGQGPRHI
jgi:hypothetical protein